MIYRVMTKLDTGHVPGDLVKTGWKSARIIEILEQKGRIQRIDTPPLDQLPGWELRARKLERAGVVTIDDFFNTDKEAIVTALGHKTGRAYRQYRRELWQWIDTKQIQRS